MGKNKKSRTDIVFSTDPNYEYQFENSNEYDTLSPENQHLYVFHDRKHRKGKTVTIVEGFVGTISDLNELSKKLKAACGVGGSVKDGLILIQGEIREKVVSVLERNSYKVTKWGG